MNDTQTLPSRFCLIIEVLVIHHPRYTDLGFTMQLAGQIQRASEFSPSKSLTLKGGLCEPVLHSINCPRALS